jgi:hypothetical protein
LSIDVGKWLPAGKLTSLWTAAGFFYMMTVVKLPAFEQTVNNHLL